MRFIRLIAIPGSLLFVGASLASASASPAASGPRVIHASAASQHLAIDCAYSANCAEVANPADVFGSRYVGHDEPSNIFYSNVPGAGNRMSYSIRLPHDPSTINPNKPGKSYEFELNGTFWLGMALCATQSYPNTVSTCTPDSDSNIVDPSVSPDHPGTAFLELQFYPPGWIPWPTWAQAIGASGCDPTRWCVAMNIFSLAENPVTGTTLNSTCAAKTGLEYVNFAFVTKNGVSQTPANPIQSTLATFTPDLNKDLLMNSGDDLTVRLHDTPDGLRAAIHDRTSGQTGSMTASAGNGFGQVQYDPTGTSCVNQPYDFHPMYSTSSEQTRVIWAAHSYNIAFSDEIGHFENCNGPNPIPASEFGVDSSGNPITCPAGDSEGFGSGASPTDADDDFCFPGSEALVIHVNGCTDTNAGFDGLDYQPVWPDGNTAMHPEPVLFSSPQTGRHYERPVLAERVRGRPAAYRGRLQPDHRRRLHPDPDNGRRHASRVLPVLQRIRQARPGSPAWPGRPRLRMGVRQPPSRRERLRPQLPVRDAADQLLPSFRRRWHDAEPDQQLPRSHA